MDFKQKSISTALKYYQNYLEGLDSYEYIKHLQAEYYEEAKEDLNKEFDYLNTLDLLDDEKHKKLLFNIRFSDSDDPNDFDKEALKEMIYHIDLDKYANPTFEGYDSKILKVYINYKKQQA